MTQLENIEKKLDQLMLYMENNYRQMESLIGIYNVLEINYPLPATRGWAISPDLGLLLVKEVLDKKPQLIMEAGCGLSTLIMGYCLKKIGHGKIKALEHNSKYLEELQGQIQLHGLEDYVELTYAPLVDHTINDKTWKWYDLSNIQFSNQIDLFLIDGPPADTQPLARYPAFPLLKENFHDNFMVIMDDSYRQDEQKCAKLWLQENPGLNAVFLKNEKGTIVIRK